MITPKLIKNFFKNNTLVDWLNLYRPEKNLCFFQTSSYNIDANLKDDTHTIKDLYLKNDKYHAVIPFIIDAKKVDVVDTNVKTPNVIIVPYAGIGNFYNDKYFNQPSSRLYLQDFQPKLYSYAVDQTPINSNIGITYSPQQAPRFKDQVASSDKNTYPLYTRIDPQLVREDGTPGQIAINPIRTDWSAKYSDYEPPAGSINFEDIYDPRFNSYAAEERAYSDINLGQVRYWYSDIDAYKMPNFIQRSNVDFVEYTTPQGQVWPEYNRTATLDEIRNKVESQTTADEVYHREDMMENLMSKMNRMNWQLRQAPLSRAAHSNMGFGPSS